MRIFSETILPRVDTGKLRVVYRRWPKENRPVMPKKAKTYKNSALITIYRCVRMLYDAS